MTLNRAIYYLISIVIGITCCSCADNKRAKPSVPSDCFFNEGRRRMLISTEHCMRYYPVQHVNGLWLVGLEKSYFFPVGDHVPDKLIIKSDAIWASPGTKYNNLLTKLINDSSVTTYRVSADVHFPPVPGRYGHMGVSNRGLLFNKIISISRVARQPSIEYYE